MCCILKHCNLQNVYTDCPLLPIQAYHCPVILGILQDHGLSLSALQLDSTGIIQSALIANLWKKSANSHRITKVWQSDFAPSAIQGDGNRDTSAWTWSFLKANGGIFSWSLGDPTIFELIGNESSLALHRSVQDQLWEGATTSIPDHSFGIISDDSKSLKGSISDECTTLLGPLPCTEHRHLLYSGQKIRNRHGLANSSTSTSELYGASDFDIGIPSSTGGILLNLSLIVEFQQTGKEQIAEVCLSIRILFIFAMPKNLHMLFPRRTGFVASNVLLHSMYA